MITEAYTDDELITIRELLVRMNHRRRQRNRKPVSFGMLPPLGDDPSKHYLVDTYTVRRHWRRRPSYTSQLLRPSDILANGDRYRKDGRWCAVHPGWYGCRVSAVGAPVRRFKPTT